jgi:tRNA (Thr-GGU) A37 N-methylase
MPIIYLYSPLPNAPQGLLEELCMRATEVLGLPADHAWALWQHTALSNVHRIGWKNDRVPAPLVVVNCKSLYTDVQVRNLLHVISRTVVAKTGCEATEVFVGVQRFHPGDLWVRGEVWRNGKTEGDDITIRPIGIVRCDRIEPVDDHWGDVVSVIELDDKRVGSDAVLGLDTFSHLEVVFLLHQVNVEDVAWGARHPRNREDWPLVGILSQRAKRRPNRISISRCELLSVNGLSLQVKGLDAIDRSPVLDLKPFYREFGPRGVVTQPVWVSELMRNYY